MGWGGGINGLGRFRFQTIFSLNCPPPPPPLHLPCRLKLGRMDGLGRHMPLCVANQITSLYPPTPVRPLHVPCRLVCGGAGRPRPRRHSGSAVGHPRRQGGGRGGRAGDWAPVRGPGPPALLRDLRSAESPQPHPPSALPDGGLPFHMSVWVQVGSRATAADCTCCGPVVVFGPGSSVLH